ncbi:MAG: ParB/RepB/Spo0J family partition protein [archaeon]
MNQKKKILDKRIGTKTLDLERIVLLDNYRTNFAMKDITQLAESIKEVGQIQPVIVNQRSDGKYELVAGQRRYYAVNKAGLETIKCVVYKDLSTEEICKIQLSENIKKPYGPVGKAKSIPEAHGLAEKFENRKISMNEFARKINIPQSTVKEAYLFKNLTHTVREAVEQGRISYSIGIQIGRVDAETQASVMNMCLSDKFKNAKEVARYITETKQNRERSAEFKLSNKEEDNQGHITDKIKDYSNLMRKTASYMKSLFMLFGENKEARETVRKAKIHRWVLEDLIKDLTKCAPCLEEKIRSYNPEGLEEALHPKKKKHILDLILKERKVNHTGETAHDLLRNARETEIGIGNIYRDKNQPRIVNTPEYKAYIKTLAENMKEMGILEPILVVRRKTKEGDYRIVDGESRWRAAKEAGIKNVPVYVADLDDISCYIIQLAADIFRKDSDVERAQAISRLAEEKQKSDDYSKQEFSKEVEAFMGMKPAEVRRYMKFFELDSHTKQLVYNKSISLTVALELYKVNDAKQRRELSNIIVAESLKTQNVKELVANTLQTNEWYSGIGGKEKAYVEECNDIGQKLAKSNILCNAIKHFAGLNEMLKKLPKEERFYKDSRIAGGYAFLKNALEGFNNMLGAEKQ